MRFNTWVSGVLLLLAPVAVRAQYGSWEFDNGRFGAWFQLAGAGTGSFLGVDVCEIDRERTRSLNLKEERGVEITRVQEDSPASRAGLKKGDVVLEFNGQRVEGTEMFMRLVRETPAGREVKLLVSRGGSSQSLTATIGSRPAPMITGIPGEGFRVEIPEIRFPDTSRSIGVWRAGMLGVVTETLGSQLAAYFGVKEGVLVQQVQAGSAAEKAGIRAGDVITRVDGEAISSSSELTRAIRSARSKRTFPVTLFRDRKEMTVTVNLEDDAALRPRSRPVILERRRL